MHILSSTPQINRLLFVKQAAISILAEFAKFSDNSYTIIYHTHKKNSTKYVEFQKKF